MEGLNDVFDEDGTIFYYILSKIYDDFNENKTNRVTDLEEVFGEGISDYVFRLKEKEYIDFVETRVNGTTFHFLDINDRGIEALKTIYDPDAIKQKIELEKQEKIQTELEKNQEKSHRGRVLHWTKIGVIVSGAFSFAAIVISILAYLKNN